MLQLLTLKFSNIRRFVEEQEIDFSNRPKLVQVDGRNENTGGSSGAGKTTIFLALDYLLGISDIPSTILQSRLTKESMYVSGKFLCDGKPLEISRSKKGLTVNYDGETISGNVKLAEEKLEELIGIPKKIFKKMVHKKQKEGGFFIDMTGKETYEFLSNILDLDKYSALSVSISENVKNMVFEINESQTKLELNRSSIMDLERILSSKEKPLLKTSAKEVSDLESKLNSLKEKREKIKLDMSLKLQDIPKPKISQDSFDRSEINRLTDLLEKAGKEASDINFKKHSIEKRQSEFPLLIEKARAIAREITKLKTEKDHIQSSSCPTCSQKWVGESANAAIRKIEESIKNLTIEGVKIKDTLKAKPQLESELLDLNKNYMNLESDIVALRKMLLAENERELLFNSSQKKVISKAFEDFNLKKGLIESKFSSAIEKLESMIRDLEISLTEKRGQLSFYEDSIRKYEQEVGHLASSINEKTRLVGELEKRIVYLNKKINVAEESRRMIRLYTLQIFQDTLDLIGEMATQILSGIPNMQNATIYFEGCKENKDGSIKDEVTGIINLDGEPVPIKSLSGGERTAIDLAVDLAVIDVIETRAGKGADFYVIDEPFDGLDAVCKENSLEILRQIDTNKKIIMVDHSSELKEMVYDVITVVRNGETSFIAG